MATHGTTIVLLLRLTRLNLSILCLKPPKDRLLTVLAFVLLFKVGVVVWEPVQLNHVVLVIRVVAQQLSKYREVLGSNGVECWAFYFSYHLRNLSF